MKQVHIAFSGTEMSYRHAAELAGVLAGEEGGVGSPVLMAWCDRKAGRASPDIEIREPRNRWHDYGASHGGLLEVDVGEEFAFIYADGSAFDAYEPSPYMNVKDKAGMEYICQINLMSDPRKPTPEACVPLDEWTSKLT